MDELKLLTDFIPFSIKPLHLQVVDKLQKVSHVDDSALMSSVSGHIYAANKTLAARMTKEDCGQVVEVFSNLNHYRSKGWLSFLGADYEIMRADGRAVYGKTETTSKHPRKTRYLRAPSNASELVHFTRECLDNSLQENERRNRELLAQYIAKAEEKHRSPFKTTMMLMGASGAGKSSVGNHLLNSNILSVSDSTSETRSVSEYAATSSSRTLRVSNLRLSLVDTPGMNDDSGIDQDACNIWAIKTFLQQNNSVAGRAVFPNIILLCIKTDDNRYKGPESQFVRNLKLLQAMGVIDSENPNVVMVLTHAGSLPHRNVDSWKQKLESKAKHMQDILEEKLGLRPPYVFMENNYKEWELPSDDGNSGTVLPDGTVQPSNLYLTIMALLQKSGDELAYLTMRQFYKQGSHGQRFAKREGTEIVCKIASRDSLDEDEESCRQILLNNSEAYRILSQRFKTERKDHRGLIEISRREIENQLDRSVAYEPLDSPNVVHSHVSFYGSSQSAGGSTLQPSFEDSRGLDEGRVFQEPRNTINLPLILSETEDLNQIGDGHNAYNNNATGRATVILTTPLPPRDERYSTAKIALGLLGVASLGIVAIAYAPAIAAASAAASTAASAAASASASAAASAAAASISSAGAAASAAASSAASTAVSAGCSAIVSAGEIAAAVAPVILGALGRAANSLRFFGDK